MMAVQPHRFGTGAGYVMGQTITSLANATISPGSAGGFQVRKSGGVAGSWDAAAIAAPVSGTSRVRIKFGSGDYRAGLSVNPAGSTGPATGPDGAYTAWVTGGLVYLFDRFNNQLGTSQGAATGFVWVDYDVGRRQSALLQERIERFRLRSPYPHGGARRSWFELGLRIPC